MFLNCEMCLLDLSCILLKSHNIIVCIYEYFTTGNYYKSTFLMHFFIDWCLYQMMTKLMAALSK